MSSLLSEGDSQVPGIPWTVLGSNPMMNPRYLTEFLIPAVKEAESVVKTLDIVQLSKEKAFNDFAVAYKESEKSGKNAQKALNSGFSEVSKSDAFTMSREEFQGFVSQIWYAGVYGTAMHTTGAVFGMMRNGKLTEREAMAHADQTYRALKSLVRLNQMGQLNDIKKGSLGFVITTGTLIVIGIVLVVAIAIIAAAIMWTRSMSQKNAALESMCKGSKGEEFRICADALKESPGSLDLNKIASSGMNKIILVAGGVALVSFLPFVVSRVLEAREKVREAS